MRLCDFICYVRVSVGECTDVYDIFILRLRMFDPAYEFLNHQTQSTDPAKPSNNSLSVKL